MKNTFINDCELKIKQDIKKSPHYLSLSQISKSSEIQATTQLSLSKSYINQSLSSLQTFFGVDKSNFGTLAGG